MERATSQLKPTKQSDGEEDTKNTKTITAIRPNFIGRHGADRVPPFAPYKLRI